MDIVFLVKNLIYIWYWCIACADVCVCVVASGNPYFNLEKSSVLQEVATVMSCYCLFCVIDVMSYF